MATVARTGAIAEFFPDFELRTKADQDRNAYGYGDAYRHADYDADAHRYPNAYKYGYPNGYKNGHADANGDAWQLRQIHVDGIDDSAALRSQRDHA